jgi:uncharacterized protein
MAKRMKVDQLQQIPQTETISVPAQSNNRKLALLGLLGFMGIALGSLLFLPKAPQPVQDIKETVRTVIVPPSITPEPTRYPFYELTVPYLRSQTYAGALGTLEEVSTNESYTSYVTNFTSEGLNINGLLTKPVGEMPEGGWPAIVFIHGYIPPNQYATQGPAYSAYVDYLARKGFVVFKIDLRGHGESEGEPGGAYYSSDYVVDALNAYNALQGADFVNAGKIGVWGHSMAGNISMRTLAAKPEIPAAVIWGGAGFTYTDLAKYRITDASFDPSQSNTNRLRKREQIRKLYGDPDQSSFFWQQITPTNYLSDMQGAIQLHHAVDDDVVNVAYSRDLNEVLDSAGIPNEFYEYSSGGHNISGTSFVEAMDRTVAFFKKYL